MRFAPVFRFVVVVVVVIGAAASGCQPFALKGESCEDTPCAAGLVCTDGVCDDPPPPPPAPCVDDAECLLDGDASGRVCDEGVCRFDDCAIDAQCGTRICIAGTCAPTEPCLEDDDCSAIDGVGQLCIANQCRPPCFADDECGVAVGGFGLQTCVDGRCLQRCLGDFTCLGGGLCENGACRDPECAENSECEETQFCDGGRCTDFTACAEDGDCFDANLFCNLDVDPVRCDERPACRADNECGTTALCLDRHCRPAEGCTVDDDCDAADDECVGSRCVSRPDCRGSADCDAGEVCADLRCTAPADDVAPDLVVVEDALSACAGACSRVVFVGETLTFATRGFDDVGLPVPGEIAATTTGPLTVTANVNNRAVITAGAAGTGTVTFGTVVGTVIVTVTIVADSGGTDVIVNEADGRGVSGATVVIGVDSVTTVAGVASFAAAVGDAVVVSFAGRTTIVPRDLAVSGDLRVTLPAPTPPDTAAAVQVSISSTGDETGPVGVGVALPSLSSFSALTFDRLFGDVVQGSAEIPVIGALPVALPSSMTLEASLPLIGDQVVRGLAELEVAAGPAFVFALEDRREQQDLVALALGGDPTTTALDFAEQSEGMDAAVVAAGIIDASARVTDDGDRDGDGDTSELIPDYGAAPVIEARPFGPPRQRTSVIAVPPAGANERALVALGVQLPGHFLLTGTGVIRGAVGFEQEPLPEPLKLIPVSATLQNAAQVIVVSAVFTDPTVTSRAQVAAAVIAPVVDVGPLLDPPEGAFFLRDLPNDGDVSVVLPSVDAAIVRLTLARGDDIIELWAPTDGAVLLPAGFDDAILISVTAYDVDGPVFAVGNGPADLEKRARRVASAPAQ